MRRETSSADRLSAQSWANAAAALIIAALLPTATSAAEPVAVFTGTGDGTTPAFEVEDGWEARWTAEGHRFELVLTGESMGIPSILAVQTRPGSGVRNYVRAGTYHFEIRAIGAWRVEVRQRFPSIP